MAYMASLENLGQTSGDYPIYRQNLGWSAKSKIPDRLGFFRHMKTRLKRYNVFVLVEYLCSNRSESKVVIKYSGALPSITFFKRPSLLSLNSWSTGSHLSFWNARFCERRPSNLHWQSGECYARCAWSLAMKTCSNICMFCPTCRAVLKLGLERSLTGALYNMYK